MRIPHSAFLSIGTMLVFICMVGSRPMAQDPWYEQSVQRDMTGDGEPETLVLRADGPAADRLTVTFTIQGSTGRLYRTQWKSQFYFVYTPPSLDKTEPDAVERYVRKFFTGFFDGDKFSTVRAEPGLTTESREMSDAYALAYNLGEAEAEEVFQDMFDHDVPTFTFFSGGELLRTLAWSPKRNRFYVVLECC